jgi:hypothetical protein
MPKVYRPSAIELVGPAIHRPFTFPDSPDYPGVAADFMSLRPDYPGVSPYLPGVSPYLPGVSP